MSLASDDNDIMSYISSVSGMDDLPPLPIGMHDPPPIPVTDNVQAQKYAPHSEQTHVACGNIYGEQHHLVQVTSSNSTLVAWNTC